MAGTQLNMPNGLDNSSTAIVVDADQHIPSAPFYCTFETGETIKVTSGGGNTGQWTVARGQLSSTATAHKNGERLTVSISHEHTLALVAGALPPGVTSDGLTPGGEIIAGALQAGDPSAATVPSFHVLYGLLTLREVAGNIVDGDNVLAVLQSAPLSANNGNVALSVQRTGTLNGHTYTDAILDVGDETGSTGLLARYSNLGGLQFQVDADGVTVGSKLKTPASTAHTLGAYSGNSVPIYDETGTLLGYMPLYA